MIQACSASQFEEKLSDSFEVSSERDDSKEEIAQSELIALPPEEKEEQPDVKKFLKTQPKRQLTLSSKRFRKFNPQPYRIIIRLSETNPSAPAETVTTVLRDAGVVFEIEKIERLDERSFLNNPSKR